MNSRWTQDCAFCLTFQAEWVSRNTKALYQGLKNKRQKLGIQQTTFEHIHKNHNITLMYIEDIHTLLLKVKGQSLHSRKVAHNSQGVQAFYGMKGLGTLLLPQGDTLGQYRLPPAFHQASLMVHQYLFYYPEWREAFWDECFLPRNTTQWSNQVSHTDHLT